jgi:thiamine pyrophosphokinase
LKKCIILANGKPPEKKIISFFQKKEFNTLICADGGANSALKMNLIPDYIIGDLDSISNEAIRKFKNTSRIIRIKRQNDTDVEKSIKHALKLKFNETLLMGVTGNRLDHTFCNLGIVIKFFPRIKIALIAENSYLKPYTGDTLLKTCPGETVSIYGLDKRTKIISKGLKYELKNISLPFGEKESTSNVVKGSEVKLEISNGVVFVIRDINLMIKHDLF